MKERIPVSVIVMTKNEGCNIAKCLRSVANFNEILVVDSNSTDNTCAIAEEMGAKVVQFQWNGKYPKKKQWCLENISHSHDWVLYVDADEEVYPELAEEIRNLMKHSPEHAGYFVCYDYVFMGRVLKHGHRIYKLVLFNKNKGRFLDYDDLEVSNMWEVEGHYQPRIDGGMGILKNHMLHNDHDSLFHFFERHNRYSDWEAVIREKKMLVSTEEWQPNMRHLLKQIFDALPFKGLVAFLYSYVLKLGFLDGRAGFHFALTRAFYYWQIRLKLQEVRRKRCERKKRLYLLW